MKYSPRDAIGQRLQVGSIVAYPTRRGSATKMNYGVVSEIGSNLTEGIQVIKAKTRYGSSEIIEKAVRVFEIKRVVQLNLSPFADADDEMYSFLLKLQGRVISIEELINQR